ncbi:MAG: class I SAM-dependent methyltransferase [Acetobacteraceae bacterium]
MPTRAEIATAFQLCLRREMDDESAYVFFESLDNLEQVYSTLFESPEFRGRLAPPPQLIDSTKVEVEAFATPDDLARMVAHVERTWTRLGETEPHWSVITDPRFKAATFAANEAAFAEHGMSDEQGLAAAASRAGLDLSRYQTCFELGCGVGRITAWLARRFPQVVGVDISTAHLATARAALANAPNVQLRHIATLEALSALPRFDVFYSYIVLQHNPPPVIAAILTRVLERLEPGGIGFFQLPVWIPGYRFRIADYLADLRPDAMEMHALPQRDLLAVVQAAGCRVLELREDPMGLNFGGISNTLLVEKAAA